MTVDENVVDKANGPFADAQFDVSDEYALSITKLKLLTLLSLLPIALFVVVLLVLTVAFAILAVKLFPGGESGALLVVYLLAIMLSLFIFSVLIRPFFWLKQKDTGVEMDASSLLFSQTVPIVSGVTKGELKRILVSQELYVELWFDSYADYKAQRYTLSIGLPLLSLLSDKELFALVAKEAGRYHLKEQKQFYSLNRFQLAWMHAVANEYDGFSTWYFAWSDRHAVLAKMFSPLLVLNRVVPGVFSLLYRVCESVTRKSIEKLEFFSDRFLVQVIGTNGFDLLSENLVRVDQAYQISIDKVLNQESVSLNVVDLIENSFQSTKSAMGQNIEMARSERLNSWYFLPPPNLRHKSIKTSSVEPMAFESGGARYLVANFSALSEEITEKFYGEYGAEFHADKTTAGDESDNTLHIEMSTELALLKRVTSGLYRDDIVWEFPKADKFAHVPEEKLTPFLNKLVLSIRHSLPDLSRYVTLVDEYNKNQQRYHLAKWLAKDGSRERIPSDEVDKVSFFIKDFDKTFEGKREFYRKSYGVRVAAAVTLGKENKAYQSAVKIIRLLNNLSHIQDTVSDTRVKCETVKALIERRGRGESVHNKTISRFTRMALKSVGDIEQAISALPLSLLPGGFDPKENKLELESLNGEDYERLVCERFNELDAYYRAFNTALSAKLGQFVEMVESKKGIESVILAKVKPSSPSS